MTIHPSFSLFLLVWVLLFVCLIRLQFAQQTYELAANFAAARSQVTGFVIDVVSNSQIVRSFAQYQQEIAAFAACQEREGEARANYWKQALKDRLIQNLALLISEVGVLILLIYGFNRNWVCAGDFVVVVTLSIRFFSQIGLLSRQFSELLANLGECKAALSVIFQPHDVVDSLEAKPLKVEQGKLEFKQVNFHYPTGCQVFEKLSVTIEPGEKVGLVGFSGTGKTTFTQLILRQFEIQGGQILIDHQNIDEVTQDSLRQQIAIIPQDPSLFQRSLLENIRYGCLDATNDEVIAAARQACCDEFIMALPQGYQALVGERGIKLSGGQRQRVAIARAILRNAPLLILDEATSALDSVTEQAIQRMLKQWMQNRTTLVIAHRLSTLRFMDRILVFKEGDIIEDGSINQLLSQDSHFAQLWKLQSDGFLNTPCSVKKLPR